GQHPPGRRSGRVPPGAGRQAADARRTHPARTDPPDPRQRQGHPGGGRRDLGRRDDDPRLPHRRRPLRRDERPVQHLLRGAGPHPAPGGPHHRLRGPAPRPPHRDRRARRPRLSLRTTPPQPAGTASRNPPDAVSRSPLPESPMPLPRGPPMSHPFLLPLAAPAADGTPPHTGGLLLLVDGTAGLLTVAALGIALLLFLIIKVRLQPFVALLGVSIAVGLAAGLSVTELFGTAQRSDAVSTIEGGMGGILGHVAIIIGLGTMLGAILEVSGGAEVLAGRLLGLFGEKRAPLAMGLTGLIFGIPVFFDVGIFVLAP